MATVKDLVEDWIEIRSTLQRQLEMLESGLVGTGTHLSDTTTEQRRSVHGDFVPTFISALCRSTDAVSIFSGAMGAV